MISDSWPLHTLAMVLSSLARAAEQVMAASHAAIRHGPADLLKHADAAMYAGPQAGKHTRLHSRPMRSRLFTHRCTHWMAIFVVWFAALAPTLSHAFQGPAAAMLDEICTATGFVSVAADGNTVPSDAPAPGHAMGDFEHCPFCFLQGHASALPSQPPAAIAPVGLRFAVPRLFLQATRTLHVWASAQARAPPLSA